MQFWSTMEQDLLIEMKRQITNKFAKTGLDLAQAYNDMPTGSSVGKSIKAFEAKLQKGGFDSLDSMLAALSLIEACDDSTAREAHCAKRIRGHLMTVFKLFQAVFVFMDSEKLGTPAEMKQAVTAFLVRECGGQFKRSFPIRASDQSDDDYNCRLQHWLYEKASYKVQLIHKPTQAEAPVELRVPESMPSRSESSPPDAEAADGAPHQATYEHARHRDLGLVHGKDVERLCNKLKAEKYHFSDHELQEVQKSLANCQYRKGKEFNLRLCSTPEDPRPKQHTSVKHFVDDMRTRLDKSQQATDSERASASEHTPPAASQLPTAENVIGSRAATGQTPTPAKSGRAVNGEADSGSMRSQPIKPTSQAGKRQSSNLPCGSVIGPCKKQKPAREAAHQAGMSGKQQIATDFKQTEQCLIRLDACQRKIIACQTTIEQYRASDIDAQDELADLTHLQREKVDLTESLIGRVRIFRTALHGQL